MSRVRLEEQIRVVHSRARHGWPEEKDGHRTEYTHKYQITHISTATTQCLGKLGAYVETSATC